MEELTKLLDQVAGVVWGPPMLILLVGTHVYLTFRLRFIQRYLGQAIRISLQRESEGEGDVSQFGALTTALAATIGTVTSSASRPPVTSSGPVRPLDGDRRLRDRDQYAEALLLGEIPGDHRRRHVAGGPMYVLERGMRPAARSRLRGAHGGLRVRNQEYRPAARSRPSSATRSASPLGSQAGS
jgi:AGCS family alanine or glycine:cation symporter